MGEITALFLESDTWRVESLLVKLGKDIADQIGADRSMFHYHQAHASSVTKKGGLMDWFQYYFVGMYRETPLGILQRRYAAGEITTEEYEQRKMRIERDLLNPKLQSLSGVPLEQEGPA